MEPAGPKIEQVDRDGHVSRPSATPRLWPWLVGVGLLLAGVVAALVVERFRLRGG